MYQFILCCQPLFLVSLKFDTTDTADDSTLYSKCDQASDLCQELELVSKLESDLGDTVDYGRKWLVTDIVNKSSVSFFLILLK